MKVYVVGGAVRDELLGMPVADRDWVVVGATVEEMIRLGYKPVGKDFPVFLHPDTHEEYALARTERKSGRGYKGFTVYAAPEVTLEDDLRRRDLSINAMAKDASGALIDPFGGAGDVKAGLLRHVSAAFAEDPVRILRVARFAARYGFRVAEQTMALMHRMVEDGEVEDLVAERVWQEFSGGLAARTPACMFEVLERCGALARLLPEARPMLEDVSRRAGFDAALARAADAGASLAVRFALFGWYMPAEDEEPLRRLCARLRVPNDARELALVAQRCKPQLIGAACSAPHELLALLKQADGFRRADRFAQLLQVARSAELPDETLDRIRRARTAAAAVDAGAIAAAAQRKSEIPARLDAAREAAIAANPGVRNR
ncbi:MAG: multifunctional CCA tRNA nucleotidyl transferase/2'3'-cyclic phosphodiesterase/2'nucleotidase/phosphatase [Betaproteobacteria bacterium]|nr:multifunctional CCA tRNA nucleotidyl transferase/2'3'-cyclic phosphodiesterase/2'nucleotidase/phosphatase [Betaproteobacteria bacterium]